MKKNKNYYWPRVRLGVTVVIKINKKFKLINCSLRGPVVGTTFNLGKSHIFVLNAYK